ncbi:MAG: hypothetical protein ACI8RZ_000874 [Myxococcota bacterium]
MESIGLLVHVPGSRHDGSMLPLLIACQSPDGDTAAFTTDAGLILSAVLSCPEPVALSWREVGEGMVRHQDADADRLDGGGLIVEDLDGDGALEMMVFFDGSPPALYRVTDGVLVEDATDWPTLHGHPTLIDFNGDGHLDILLTTLSVLWGDSDGGLVAEVSVYEGNPSRDLLAADLDADGTQDLFIARTAQESLEQMQDHILWGDSTDFSPEGLPMASAARKAFDARLLDWDGDGDLDVYVVNDMGNEFGGNVLWRNDGGVLVDASADCDCGIVMSGMGVSVGDYNRDGWTDLYLTATQNNVLLAGEESGSFVDVTAVTGADPISGYMEMAWGSTWLDHDNDGDADLLVLQGDLYDASSEDYIVYDAPIHLLSQEEDGTFTDVAEPLGLTALGSYRAGVAAELNGDGVLDLVVTDVVDRPRVYFSEGCTAAGWLEVIAPEHSRVVVEADGQTQTVIVSRDSGYAATGPARAWFGLGGAEVVERLTVTTLDGQVRTAEGFAARRQVHVMDAAGE